MRMILLGGGRGLRDPMTAPAMIPAMMRAMTILSSTMVRFLLYQGITFGSGGYSCAPISSRTGSNSASIRKEGVYLQMVVLTMLPLVSVASDGQCACPVQV